MRLLVGGNKAFRCAKPPPGTGGAWVHAKMLSMRPTVGVARGGVHPVEDDGLRMASMAARGFGGRGP